MFETSLKPAYTETSHAVTASPKKAEPTRVASKTKVAAPTITENQNNTNARAENNNVEVTKVTKPANTSKGTAVSRKKTLEKVVAIGNDCKAR